MYFLPISSIHTFLNIPAVIRKCSVFSSSRASVNRGYLIANSALRNCTYTMIIQGKYWKTKTPENKILNYIWNYYLIQPRQKKYFRHPSSGIDINHIIWYHLYRKWCSYTVCKNFCREQQGIKAYQRKVTFNPEKIEPFVLKQFFYILYIESI